MMSEGLGIAIVALLGTVFTGIMSYFMAKQTLAANMANKLAADSNKTAKESSDKLDETNTVAKDSNEKLEQLVVVADDTHTLVNSNMGIQLMMTSSALRRIADLTKEPDDIKAADEANALLVEHERKQKIVDDRKEVKKD